MNEANERALDELVAQLKADAPPPIDWDRMERRLSLALDRDQRKLAAKSRSGVWSAFGFAAAAAVVVMALTGSQSAAPSVGASAHAQSASTRPIDAEGVALAVGAASASAHELLGLKEGDVIEAKSKAIAFGHAGAVTWTLAPGGRAVVRSLGNEGVGNVIALERGAVRAEVTPRDASEGMIEAFAVEVAGTRVAAHGTAFTVGLVGDRVVVDLEHGAVAVGPRGHVGATTGRLMVGPARAAFSLDGGRIARWMSESEAEVALDSVAPARHAAAPALSPAQIALAEAARDGVALNMATTPSKSGAPKPSHPLASGEPKPEVEAPVAVAAPPVVIVTPDVMRSRLSKCFSSAYGSGDGSVKVAVSSTFTIKIKEDGAYASGTFNPPLKPEFVACAGGTVSGNFGPGARSLDIPITFTR